MKVFYCLIFSLVFLLFPFQLYAQKETQLNVVAQINLGMKYLSQKEHIKSIEKFISAKDIALRHKWYTQAFNATLNIGTNYYLMMDYGEAFQYYIQAYEIAIKHLDVRNEMSVFNNIGVLYVEENEQLKAEESFFKAYEIAKSIGDKEKIGAYGINMALLLNRIGNIKLAEQYIEEALPLLEEKPNVLLLAKIAKAENLFLKNQFSKASELALRILPQMNNLSISEGNATVNDKITLLLILSRIYEKQFQYKEALAYALLARVTQEKIEGRKAIYKRISALYAKTDNFKMAVSYKDSAIIATDSLHAIKNAALFKSEKVKFQIQNYQHDLLESKKARNREKQLFYTVLICVIAGMGFLIWVYKNNSLKHKQGQKIIELKLEKEKSDHLLKERMHRENEALDLLEKERLKNELDTKNRELTSRAMYLASKNQLIEEVVKSLSEQTEIAVNPQLKSKVNDLKRHLKKDTHWDSFFVHFEELNRGFLARLASKHPNLTPNDIRFISFLYMNLSYKEIASLLNITPQSCRKRKERISKKMNVPEILSFYSYLSAI